MLWGGRFNEPTDEDLRRLNDSLPFDQRFAQQDIQGSIVYAGAIASAGIVSAQEAEQLVEGLQQIQSEIKAGSFVYKDGDEDIHTAIERRLTELIGALGGKLHTGRSRNDQVATDFRLWTMQAVDQIANLMTVLQAALIERSEETVDLVMPGYTHLQPAQPITAAHWLMSFFWMLQRDLDRIEDARGRTAVLPLGSGALAGTPLNIQRDEMAQQLGFEGVSANSLDAVSDRDFVAEVLFVFALLGSHLSRLAEDVIIYSNPAFGFVSLDDRYSTGSSLMPQKRNADPMELARGKAGRLLGNLTGFMASLKGLPSGYNKDLQEDKEALFDSFDSLASILPVISAVVRTLKFHPDAMEAALDPAMLATDLADYLVKKGLPFRQAHHVAGEVVALAESRDTDITQLSVRDLQGVSELFSEDVLGVFDFRKSVEKRVAPGGTAPAAVEAQIEAAKALLKREEL
jgi:argininosuccinate lyase